MRIAAGMKGDPNSPRITVTRKNMESPPPQVIDCLLLLNHAEARKHIPDIAHMVIKAPALSKSISGMEINLISIPLSFCVYL